MIYTLFLDGVCGSFHHKSLLLKLIQTCCELLIAGFVILDCVEYLRAGFAVAGMGELMCQLFEFVGVRNIVTDHLAHQSNQLIARRGCVRMVMGVFQLMGVRMVMGMTAIVFVFQMHGVSS